MNGWHQGVEEESKVSPLIFLLHLGKQATLPKASAAHHFALIINLMGFCSVIGCRLQLELPGDEVPPGSSMQELLPVTLPRSANAGSLCVRHVTSL